MSVTSGSSGHGFPAVCRRRAGCTAGGMFVLALLGVAATGCKTGTAMSAPSWLSFKGSSTKDSDKLASAPRFDGDTRKPSETAKAYPTTSTPNGYAINGDAATPGGVQTQQPVVQQPVVYGQTPPPAVAVAAAAPTAAMAAPPSEPVAGPGRVAAQVGPYAPLAGDQIPPAGQPLPNIGPVSSTPSTLAGPAAGGSSGDRFAGRPGESSLPGTAYGATPQAPVGDQPVPRMADARGVPDGRGSEPAAFAGAGAEAVGSRYSTAGASRFSGGAPEASYPAAAAPGGFGRPPESFPAAPAGEVTPAPSSGNPTTPALLPSSGPAAGQPGGLPPGQPMRRPDPGYRPFNTSSYRPAKQLLADELPGPTPVRAASFEEAAPPVR